MAQKTVLKILGDGQLAATLLPLYVVNPGRAVEVHQITLVNKDLAQRTLNFYIKVKQPSGEFGPIRLMLPRGLRVQEGERVDVLDFPLLLSDGDQFQAFADVANVVDYWISGIERKVEGDGSIDT